MMLDENAGSQKHGSGGLSERWVLWGLEQCAVAVPEDRESRDVAGG